MNASMFFNANNLSPARLRSRAGRKSYSKSLKLEAMSVKANGKLKSVPFRKTKGPGNDNKLGAETVGSGIHSKIALASANDAPATSQDTAAVLKPEVWAELIASRQLGYFALLRNLRTIMISVPHCLDDVIAMLTDEAAIDRSRVLPISFIAALEAVAKNPPLGVLRALAALSDATDLSLANLPKFTGRTLVALHGSKSMSSRSLQIGSLLAASLTKTSNADVMLFDQQARYVTLNRRDSTLSIARQLESQCTAADTNFHTIFQQAHPGYDRVILLSDRHGWTGDHALTATFAKWKAQYLCEPKVFSFDLSSLGTLQFPERDIYCLAGWSDKSLEMLNFFDSGKSALMKEIEKIELV